MRTRSSFIAFYDVPSKITGPVGTRTLSSGCLRTPSESKAQSSDWDVLFCLVSHCRHPSSGPGPLRPRRNPLGRPHRSNVRRPARSTKTRLQQNSRGSSTTLSQERFRMSLNVTKRLEVNMNLVIRVLSHKQEI